MVIASKAGYRLPTQRRLIARIKPFVRPVIRLLGLKRASLPASVRGAPTQDFSPAYLRTAVEGSLRRLRTDHLDIFQLHSPPEEVIVRGDWTGALEDLKRAGKIRHWGISVDTIEAGQAALRHSGASALQFTASLLEPRSAEALLPLARENSTGVIARECLANGLLIKNENEIDLAAFFATPEERTRRAAELAAHRRRAADSGTTLAGLALTYVTNLDGVSVSLLGARTEDQLKALLRHLPPDK